VCNGRHHSGSFAPNEKLVLKRLSALGFLVLATASAAAPPETNRDRSLSERAAALGPGQYVWDAKNASRGPLFLTIELTGQRLTVYRDGVLVGASAISTGTMGRETPTGVFTILEKKVMHRSTTYDNAPMPYMQRLTSKGIAIHAGDLPGYPASHGCIRLPNEFAKLLYGVTEVGTPVMITDNAQIAEQKRIADEYQRAKDDYSRTVTEQQAAADRVLIDYANAKAAHRRMVQQHEAEMAKYKAMTAPK
jgi:hypothetical protein